MPHATRAPQVPNFVVLGSPCPPVVPRFKPIVDAREAFGLALLRLQLLCLRIWEDSGRLLCFFRISLLGVLRVGDVQDRYSVRVVGGEEALAADGHPVERPFRVESS